MPGIFQRLGGFGSKVIRKAQELGRTLGEALHIIQPIAPEVEPMAAARDWGRVSTMDALEPKIAALRPDQNISRDLYVTTPVPWKMKYAYEVSIYGRDLVTGKFTRRKYNLGSNVELDVQGVLDLADVVIGKKGTSPELEVFDTRITGAWKSSEIEW